MQANPIASVTPVEDLIKDPAVQRQTKAGEFFKLLTSSPLFWVFAQVTTVAITATVVVNSLAFPGVFLIAGVGLSILGIAAYSISRKKDLIYETSLTLTIIKKFFGRQNWWSDVSEHIVLGSIPLRNKHHFEQIREKGVKAVLTLLQKFEMKDRLFILPVQKEAWLKESIAYKRIPAKDFKAVKLEHIKKGVEFMHTHISQGERVYVHCKAGRGRSATLVICYLLQYGEEGVPKFKTADEAFQYVRAKRREINLNAMQRQAIDDYYEQCIMSPR